MGFTASQKDYRPEIEGLRTLAAGLVAIFHIWFGGVSGGVDVFFVVSGYLVTTSLLSQQLKMGRIAPLAFWANIAKRILPTAFLVIFVTALAGAALLPQVLWVDTIRHAAASLVYVENWWLAFDAVNYLSQGMEATPYQHYWALSVQGQFYLVWPMLLFVILWRVNGPQEVRYRLSVAFAAVFSISLIYSIIATAHNQPFTYYNSFARIWEFTLGALLAVWIMKIRLGRSMSRLIGWFGLIGLLSCGFVLDVSDQFPGYVALLPTISAALLILSGSNPAAGGAAALLSKGPIVRLGAISYAFYLWHWPILILFRHYTNGPDISLLEGSFIIALAVILAVISTWLLEAPIRRSTLGKAKPMRTFAVMLALSLPAGGAVGSWAGYTKSVLLSDMAALDIDDPDYLGARALFVTEEEKAALPTGELYPTPVNARRDRPRAYADKCQQESTNPDLLRCEYGMKNSDTKIAVVGGSHSTQWLPAFEVFAKEENYKIVSYTKSFCLFSSPAGFGTVYTYPSCTEWNTRLMKELIATRPDLVFTTYTRDGGRNEYVPSGFLDWFQKLEENGIRVLAVRDNPWLPFEPSKCVELYGVESRKCQVARDEVLARVDPLVHVDAELGNVSFVDFSRFFCDETLCFPAVGNVLIYRDSHHITTSYMRTLAAYLRPEVKTAMNKGHADRR